MINHTLNSSFILVVVEVIVRAVQYDDMNRGTREQWLSIDISLNRYYCYFSSVKSHVVWRLSYTTSLIIMFILHNSYSGSTYTLSDRLTTRVFLYLFLMFYVNIVLIGLLAALMEISETVWFTFYLY